MITLPNIILADEPTENLRSALGQEIMNLFTQLNDEGATIVQVTPFDPNAAYGRRVVELCDGWVAK